MTNEFVVGILTTVIIAAFGGFYVLLKLEIKVLRTEMEAGFADLKKDLKIHELEHHQK